MEANFKTISALIIIGITIIGLLICNIAYPKIKLGKRIALSSFWIVALIGALLLIIFQDVSVQNFWNIITSDTSVNPLKVVVLFFSMAFLSIFLDEIGFFSYIAFKLSNRFGKNQFTLFVGLFASISVLTVFTSNDIIILTFTPFICYLAKHCKIDPIPYLIMEFISANTMSMLLIIGNPTNIYLATSFAIDFMDYLTNMLVPTLVGAIVSLIILLLLFFKKLKKPLQIVDEEIEKPNKILMYIGLVILLATTIMLAISNYIGLEMWIVALIGAGLELLIMLIISILKKEFILKNVFKHIPINLLPFILSMFIIVLSLNEIGFSKVLSDMLYQKEVTFSFGISGAIVANIINNIPMSLLYANVLNATSNKAIYASIAASNIAAYITPLGALAGIMFVSLSKKGGAKLNYLTFTKYGIIVAIPTLFVTLLMIFLLVN